jgi:hypothetical protein
MNSISRRINKIHEMQHIATQKNGLCLSRKYKDQKTKLVWQCEAGHRWESSPNSVVHLNAWCPVCAGNRKLTINEARELARSKGGKCLSAEYHNTKKKMLWECKKGHHWFASTFSIKTRNSWCPECYKLIKQKIYSHENNI